MNDPFVFKDEHGCHIKINGQWWRNFKPFLARCLLKASGFANATAIVRDAPTTRNLDFDFNGKWTINGRTVNEEKMKTSLKRIGLDDFAVETIMRIHKKCYQIEKMLKFGEN
jgi:hypothetical protein